MTGWPQYAVLLPFALVAAGTDVWRHKIHNWTTYPGILVGLLVNVVVGGLGILAVGPETAAGELSGLAGGLTDGAGWSWSAAGDGAVHGLLGFLACGFVMLLCFVFFPVGGGDVKLVAMFGAFLGIDHGIEVLLWTFVLGAVMSIAVLIWQVGAVELGWRTFGHLWWVVRTGGKVPLAEEERKPLQQELFLGVAALLAVAVVMIRKGVW